MLDMQSEGQPINLETLEMIHKTKTGALLTFCGYECSRYR